MTTDDRDLSEKVLAAQVLTLSHAIRQERRVSGASLGSTAENVRDAVNAIREQRGEIVRLLGERGVAVSG